MPYPVAIPPNRGAWEVMEYSWSALSSRCCISCSHGVLKLGVGNCGVNGVWNIGITAIGDIGEPPAPLPKGMGGRKFPVLAGVIIKGEGKTDGWVKDPSIPAA
jgi:hypothetical protein